MNAMGGAGRLGFKIGGSLKRPGVVSRVGDAEGDLIPGLLDIHGGTVRRECNG